MGWSLRKKRKLRKADREEEYTPAEVREIAVGDTVKLRSFGSIGIVDSLKGDEAEVRVKSLRFREKLENLELVELSDAPAKTAKRRSSRVCERRAALKFNSNRCRETAARKLM